MRHGKKFNHLSRKSAHRKAMLANMACSLILHKRINTTVAKAKALRTYVEPLLTKSKNDTTHSRRTVFSYLKNKEAIKELFGVIAPKIENRNGGYTRIIKTGFRLGDAADMAMIELVDFNEIYNPKETKKTTRRSRRGGGKSSEEKSATVEAKQDAASAATEQPTASADVVASDVEETPTPDTDNSKNDAAPTTEEEGV